MTNHAGGTRNARRKPLVTMASAVVLAVMLFVCAVAAALMAQTTTDQAPSPAVPQWQINAGGKKQFDVASVKRNITTGAALRPGSVNFPLDSGDSYTADAGFLMTEGLSLRGYIAFAYKLRPYQTRSLQLPNWASTARYDIQARAEGKPTKDQMRLMMQALLADRFKLKAHFETKEIPVFALVLLKPATLGPQLQGQSEERPCAESSPPANAARIPAAEPSKSLFPCDTFGATAPGNWRGQRLTMAQIADNLVSAGNLDRPVIDKTELGGRRFDLTIQFAPDPAGRGPSGGPIATPDQTEPTFFEALRNQLGLKLEPTKGPVNILVIDHIEEPSPN